MQSAFKFIQSAAVLREYREALADGNHTLAEKIRLANPDLFPPEEEVKGG